MDHLLPLKPRASKYFRFCKFYICQCLKSPAQHPIGSRKE